MRLHLLHFFLKLRVHREVLACISVGLMTFVISLILSGWYTDGDQVGYHLAYELVRGLGPTEGRVVYNIKITSNEGVHFWFLLLSGIIDIDKNLFMSVINGILSAYILLLLFRWEANFWLAIAIVMTNYYLYVLYITAERLKLALLFLVLSLLFNKTRIKFIIFLITSIFAHFSIIIIYSGSFLASLADKFAMWRSDKLLINYFLCILIASLLVITNFDYLYWKVNSYITSSQGFNIFALIPVIILVFFSFLYSDSYKKIALQFLPVVLGIALIGGSRLNMFAFLERLEILRIFNRSKVILV